MNGYDYEFAVAHWLRRHGYHGVKVTQASGDYGVDLLAMRHGIRYAIQCKYYSHPVGIAAVQQAVAGKAKYECDQAMVISNMTFTKAAITLAKSNDVLLLPEISARKPLLSGTAWRVIFIALAILWLCAVICCAGLIVTGDAHKYGMPETWQELTAIAAVLPAVCLVIWISGRHYWRMVAAVQRKRQIRADERSETIEADLAACSQYAYNASKVIDRERALLAASGKPSAADILAAFNNSRMMQRFLSATTYRKSFTIRSVTAETGMTVQQATALADCLIQSGYLICTKPLHYGWSLISQKKRPES